MCRTHSLYYLVLRCSSDLCAAYLDYSAALTQKLRALAAPTELVAATASHFPPPLKSQWWCSCSEYFDWHALRSIIQLPLFVQISQQITHIQAYIRTQKRTRSYTEKYLHRTKWPIDRPTNTAADTATASAKDSTDAPANAPVDAPA